MTSIVDKVYALLGDAWSTVRGAAVGFVDGDGLWAPASSANPLPVTGVVYSTAIGTTADPATIGTDNTSTGTALANLKSINNQLSSTLPVSTYRSASWTYITGKTTTVVLAVPGTIDGLEITKTGTADVITIYDALTATGTPIVITGATVGMEFLKGCYFAVGCTIVISGTTAGEYLVKRR